MEMNFRQKKGITLIALVITIIVLLILAGVTIATLTGDNGLLTKTSKANLETRGASVEERKDLWKTEQNTDNYVEGDTAQSLDELLNELEKEGLITPEERIQIEENGNEYVWIEVPKSIIQTANTKEELYNVLNEYSIDYKDTWDWGMDNSDIWYEGCGMTEEEYNDNYMKMLNSIKENGGFYIGRYEMGSIESRTESSDITQSGVKKDMYPYNWVTMEEAQNICETYSLGDRTSSLMYDIQYNLACKFLEVKSDELTVEDIAKNSEKWGNYSSHDMQLNRGKYSIDRGNTWLDFTTDSEAVENRVRKNGKATLITTGASEENRVLNIYDFTGNTFCYTLGNYSTADDINGVPVVIRGGYYNDNGTYMAACWNSWAESTTQCEYFGFRNCIY